MSDIPPYGGHNLQVENRWSRGTENSWEEGQEKEKEGK